MTSKSPFLAAYISGVSPQESETLTSAPHSTRILTTFKFPFLQTAFISAVFPIQCTASTSAPASMRNRTTARFPSPAALIRAVS
ncbi:hypothetical protein PHMEG_0004900 [Phytophthora megakarya]|uniref:Uncharacterized protein n=1 Tax=Phytophthora megakarya TaxID=4795 RepID=A0A225WSS6_9STRA|nr:hypothetical protein PHMEG_0004900 [Phytophthora megakarya]